MARYQVSITGVQGMTSDTPDTNRITDFDDEAPEFKHVLGWIADQVRIVPKKVTNMTRQQNGFFGLPGSSLKTLSLMFHHTGSDKVAIIDAGLMLLNPEAAAHDVWQQLGYTAPAGYFRYLGYEMETAPNPIGELWSDHPWAKSGWHVYRPAATDDAVRFPAGGVEGGAVYKRIERGLVATYEVHQTTSGRAWVRQ